MTKNSPLKPILAYSTRILQERSITDRIFTVWKGRELVNSESIATKTVLTPGQVQAIDSYEVPRLTPPTNGLQPFLDGDRLPVDDMGRALVRGPAGPGVVLAPLRGPCRGQSSAGHGGGREQEAKGGAQGGQDRGKGIRQGGRHHGQGHEF